MFFQSINKNYKYKVSLVRFDELAASETDTVNLTIFFRVCLSIPNAAILAAIARKHNTL